MNNKPMYLQIADDIKEKIHAGFLHPNEPIPSETALGEMYGVSRLTARKVMEALEKEAFITTEPGKGSFVREINKDEYKISFDRQNLENHTINKIHVLNVAIIESTKELVYKLQIPPHVRVITIERLLLENEMILAYDIKYMPYYARIPLTEDKLESQNFEQILEDKSSLYAMEKELSFYSAMADKTIADYLKVNIGYPVTVLEETLSDLNLGTLGWGKTFYDYKAVAVHGEMYKKIVR